MQDMQVARHTPYKGKPYLFHGLRVLWLSAVGERRQDRFPGPSWQAQQKQNRLGVNTYCMMKERSFSARLSHVVHFFSQFMTDINLTRYDSDRAGFRHC
jgi:hypothetical protein